MYYILGMLVFWFAIFWGMVMKGVSPSVLFVPSAIVLHLFTILGVLTATQNFKVFWGGLRAAIFPKRPLTEEIRGRAASLYRLLSKTAALVSVMGLIFGGIAALGNMYDVEALGHAVAAALVSLLLGLILISSIFEPLVFILKNRQGVERHAERRPLRTAGVRLKKTSNRIII